MTLRQKYNAALAELTKTQDELSQALTDLTNCQAGSNAKDATIAEQQATVADLKSQVSALEARVAELEGQTDPFETVPAGANLQSVLKAAGEGARLQLPATLKFNGSVTPLANQYLRGPCVITPAAGANVGFAINCKTNEAEGVTLEDLDVSGFSLRGCQPWAGGLIKGGRYHHNGEMGIGVDMNGRDLPVLTLDGVETDHNGATEVLGHGAGGVKFFHVRRTRVLNCNTHENTGNGWWWDAECGEAEVIGGRCWMNLRKGLFWEKCGGAHASSGAVYDGMLVVDGGTEFQDNNQEKSAQGNAGIYCVASKNMTVKNSSFVGNINAIVVRNDDRRLTGQHADHPGWVTSNIKIDDSTNEYDGDKVVIGPDVSGVSRA